MGSANTGIEMSTTQTQILTVPSVASDQTAYIRVKNGASPSVTAKYADGTDATLSEVYTSDGYSSYKVEGNGKDIDFYLTDVTVMQSAVSIDTKTVTSAGYATEARSYPVDYTMAQTFLGNEQKAYVVTGVNDNKVIVAEAQYVHQGDGIIVTGTKDENTYWPLFTTDVNRSTSTVTNNLLVGVLTPPAENVDQTTNGKYNYVLSTGGKVVRKIGDEYIAGESVSGLGFYLVHKIGTKIGNTTYNGSKPKANTSYLQLDELLAVHQDFEETTSTSSPRFCFFLDFNGETTAIDAVPVTPSNMIRGEEGVYYTLQGVRVTTPVKGNLYILNGKKVFIK